MISCVLSFVDVLRLSFGAPISRNRVYLLLLRRDVMLKRAKDNFSQFASGICEALGMKPECSWLFVCSLTANQKMFCESYLIFTGGFMFGQLRHDLLLDKGHPVVKELVESRKQQREKVKMKLFQKNLDTMAFDLIITMYMM